MAKEKIENKEHELKKDKEFAIEERSFKEKLQAEKKVKVIIPLDPLNPSEPQIVSVNGVTYSIPRGKEIEIPETIARVWQESYNKTIKSQLNARIVNLGKNDVEIIE